VLFLVLLIFLLKQKVLHLDYFLSVVQINSDELESKVIKKILKSKHFCLFVKHKIVFMLLRIFLLVLGVVILTACGGGNEKKLGKEFYKTIGYQIRAQRLVKGISQQKLADAVGVTQNSLSLIEDGLATPIHTKLIAIQQYLEVEFKINGKYSKIEDYIKNIEK
jgi:DNA-binding XRE family transcriptional regulator